MPEGLEKIGLAVAVGLIIIVVVFFWLLPVELPPILSEMSGSEIISSIFLYTVGVLLMGVLLIIVVIILLKKRVI